MNFNSYCRLCWMGVASKVQTGRKEVASEFLMSRRDSGPEPVT